MDNSIVHFLFVLLTLDIGNTAMKFGVFDGDTLVSKFVIPTRREYSEDEISAEVAKRIPSGVSGSIVSSVVPEVNDAVQSFLTSALKQSPRFVSPTDDLGLTFNFPVEDAGTDHLINSFAAAELFGVPCIVIAFGTATTIDVVNREREHRGGLIAPGPRATAKALQIITSKLPEVEIYEPPNVMSTNTVDAIRSGIFYSQIGLIEAAIPPIRSEIGEDAKVIATGGFAPLFAGSCRVIEYIEPDLTLLGLKMLYSRG